MITFKPEVFAHHRKQDGTYNVKIRVTFQRKSRHLPTTIYCTQADLTRSLKLKNGDIINKANALCSQMRAACSDLNIFDLEGRDVDFVVRHIKDSLKTEQFSLDFFRWADEYLQCKTPQTRRTYDTALSSFARFLGRRELDINDITHSMMMDFVAYIDDSNRYHFDTKAGRAIETSVPRVNKGASSIYIMKLAHIFNAAKLKYNDEDSSRILIPRSPFDKIHKVFPPSQGQKNLGQELMQKIIRAQTGEELMRVALDAFIVSFGLMGANYADLYGAVPFSGEWQYNRQKTRTRRADHAEMRVIVPPELGPYIDRLQGHRGAWWFPTLHWLADDKDKSAARVNKCLKRWCRNNGIPEFTFYAARHTWASLARKAGVEKATIDECLAHKGDYEMADIYAERDWDKINEANRRVIDLFEWN